MPRHKRKTPRTWRFLGWDTAGGLGRNRTTDTRIFKTYRRHQRPVWQGIAAAQEAKSSLKYYTTWHIPGTARFILGTRGIRQQAPARR